VRDRARIPLPGSWRITVTSLFPYSGTTTLAGVIGLTLTGMRAHPVLAVDLWPGESPDPAGAPASSADEDEPRGDPLTSRVGSAGTTSVTDVLRHQAGDGSPAELHLMISGQRSGSARDLDVLPVRRDAGHLARAPQPADDAADRDVPAVAIEDQPVTPGGLRSVLGLLAHSYPLVLVDAPTEAPLTDAAVEAADLVVLVTLATAADLEATLMRLRAFREASGGHLTGGGAPPIVAAIVAPRRGRPSPRTRAAAARLGRQVEALVRIPYDPRLDPSRHTPVRIPRLRRRTRRAYLRLAAATVENLFILAKAEVGASAATGERAAVAARGAAEPVMTRTQSGATGGPSATTGDHEASTGVSFGDLRSPTAPSRIAGPDRPGEPRP
jgi:cellulose biosynthesis protein BcsQ